MQKLFSCFFLVFCAYMATGQEVQRIKGEVVDSQTLQPLSAATVLVQGSAISTLTDENGSFFLEDVKTGDHFVLVSYVGYHTKRFSVSVAPDEPTDLGTILLEEDFTSEAQSGLITLTENDLGDDNSSLETSAGLLQATRDVFQQAAAFNWGQSFFRIRALDNEYSSTLINGVVMNKIYDGRPQWSNWGGLNDATRNQEFSSGSTPSSYTFGGILGTQAITTRASHIRKGNRAGFSFSNTNYNWRPTFTHSSGMNKNGWAYVISGSYRGAKEGRFEGTNYDAKSLFIAVEKKFNDNHSLNFTGIYAQNKRGKSAPVTDEQTDLKNYKYNSYWGWQNGDKRNSRYKNVEEPILMLTHYWKINDKNHLTSTVAYQFGHIANSRLGYQSNLNPDPTYYQNMPSYFLNKSDYDTWEWKPEKINADSKRDDFIRGGQIDWSDIYKKNIENNGVSKILLYEDRQEDKTFSFNSNLKSQLSDHIILDAGLNYRRLKSDNFKKAIDLLGGTTYKDIDTYQEGSEQHSDLSHPDRYIKEGDKFGYNYSMFANVFNIFTQFSFDYEKVVFYLAQNIGYTSYEREGHYKNGIYPSNSFGKSGKTTFNNFGFKGGLIYHITGRHALSANIAYYNQAPSIRSAFANARINNSTTPDIGNEDIFNIDASYLIRTPKFKARFTGYLSEIKNNTQLNFYYADGAGIVGEDGELLTKSGGAFVAEILTGINKRSVGIEIGAEYQISQTLKATTAIALGQAFYTNNPNIKLSSDNARNVFDYGTSFLKSYRLANGPQTALSLGLEYRAPRFWWIGANVNYLDNRYINISALRRTQNFVTDPNFPGQPLPNLDEDKVQSLLKQEQLNDITVFNITGGKSWMLPNRNILGFFASVNNVFNRTYKTGGFEQARNANYKQEILNSQSGVNTFANKYWYAFGRNFFINVYYNF